MTPSIYINLEDDVSKVVTRLKHQPAKQVVLVCPKRCFLFNDSINLRLLKKQTDLLGKEVFILTMDERGQMYAKEAGFGLRFLPKGSSSRSFSDVKVISPKAEIKNYPANSEHAGVLEGAISEIKHIAEKIVPKKTSDQTALTKTTRTAGKKPVVTKPDVAVTDAFFPKEVLTELSSIHRKKGAGKKVTVGALVICLALALLLYFVILPKADVVVFPKTEAVTRDMEISMSTNVRNFDPNKLVMAAAAVLESSSVSGKFESQGKIQVGNKASGSIKIYNFTQSPINLKAGTTILTAGSKSYSLSEDVLGLKPTIYKNAKTKEIDEASLGSSVSIVAQGGGEDFNLPAGSRLEITNQVFGSKPQLLFAKADSEISGGTTRYLSVISQSDIDSAKAQLLQQVLQQINTKLSAQNQVLIEKAYNAEIVQFTTNNAVGVQTPNFSATLEAKITGLAYNKEDLQNLIYQRITQTLSANKTLRVNEDAFTVKVKSLDLNSQLAVLNAHFEGQAVFNVDLGAVAPELVNKTQNEVYEILKSKAEIQQVDISLAPQWQKKFPLFASKIHLTVSQQTQGE